MIDQSGVIYQYGGVVDTPATLSPEVISAFEPQILDDVPVSSTAGTISWSRNFFRKSFSGVIVGGIIGLFVLASPLIYIEARYRIAQMRNIDPDQQVYDAVSSAIQVPTPTPRTIVSSYNVDLTPTPVPLLPANYGTALNNAYMQVLAPVDREFSVVIPKIGVNSKIVRDVNPGNEEEYRQALRQGVAHSKGSFVPGQNGTMYVFAHSTDYVWNIEQFNAVFFLLREMEESDQIYVVHDNKVYPYQVSETRVVEPGETYYLKPKQDGEELILQTCWPPGTTEKRLLVFAKPGGSIPETEVVDSLSYSP